MNLETLDPLDSDSKREAQRLSTSFPAFNADFYLEAHSIVERLDGTGKGGVRQSIGMWFKYYGFLVEVLLKFDEAVTVLMGLWSKLPSVDDSTLPLLTKEEGRQPLIFLPKYPALYRSDLPPK
jgi:hypothetical protein